MQWSISHALFQHSIELLLLATCLWVTLVFSASMWRTFRHRVRFQLDESGGLSEELVLGFPLFVLFIAMVVQMILLMHARIVVNYAAFVAARSASVWIPACYANEPPNTIRLFSQDASRGYQLITSGLSNASKLDRIRSAAILAASPVSPSYFSWIQSYTGNWQIAGLPSVDSLDRLTGPYQVA